MPARDVVALACAVLAAALVVLFLALVAQAAWARVRWSRRPVVIARVVSHEPATRTRDRAGHPRWRTVVAWQDPGGRRQQALDPPPMEPGLRWLADGDEVLVRVDGAGRARRPDAPGQALRSALLVGVLYVLLPALLLSVLAAALR